MFLSLTLDVGASADAKQILGSLSCSDCGLLVGLVGLYIEVESGSLIVLVVHVHISLFQYCLSVCLDIY